MQGQRFLLLVIVTVALVAGAWWLSQSDQPGDSVASGNALFPQLESTVNDVSRVDILGSGSEIIVQLERGDSSWTVANRDGFTADWDKVRDLLRALAQATIIEQKTSNPELYDRLGVQDIDAEGSERFLIKLDDNDELAVIVGLSASDGSGGRYVRRANEAQALLIDQSLTISNLTKEWLSKEVIDFQPTRVNEVVIRHSDGEVLRAKRDADDPSKVNLLNVPEGRELGSPWAINALPNSISRVNLEDVRPAQAAMAEPDLSVLFVADNGLNIQLDLHEEGDSEYWMQVSANAEPTAAIADSGESSAGDSDAAAGEGDEEVAPPDPAVEAQQINDRLNGWEFRIAEFKYNGWAKKLEDLLKPLEDDNATDSGDGDDA
ncbi:MAG: hypothetical protein Tsb002_36130 [Wenzhouxiangellaceae bacterium]